MKVVIAGEDRFAVAVMKTLLKEGYEISLFITPAYNKQIRLLENAALKNNIPFLSADDINAAETLSLLEKLSPDVVLLIHFNRLVHLPFIKIPKMGCINIHPSLLPQYRGRHPQYWAVINGEEKTGISIHFVDEGIDTGDIIFQKEIAITSQMYIADIQQMLLNEYGSCMLNALTRIQDKQFKPKKQPDGDFKVYRALSIKDITLDTEMSAKAVFDRIRAGSFPFLGARFEDFIFWKASFFDQQQQKDILRENNSSGFYVNTAWGDIWTAKDGVLKIEWFEQINTDKQKNDK